MKLKRPWVRQVYHSQFNTKARGTGILIHKNVQFYLNKSMLDPQGRYVIVSGSVFNVQVTLVCIYAPNWDDPTFVSRLVSDLPDMNSHRLILGGDLNSVMDLTLDRSSSKQASPSKMAYALGTFMKEMGCVDPWRFLFTGNREFLFFSHVHQSYSRIAYFLLTKACYPLSRKGNTLLLWSLTIHQLYWTYAFHLIKFSTPTGVLTQHC